MPTKSSKLIPRLLRGMLLGVLLCILGYIGFGALTRIAGDGEQAPIRNLRVTVDESQREEFFAQLQKFADKHKLEISVRDSGLSAELFVVDMRRDDMKIIIRNPFDPRIFRISFYDKYQGYPVGEETVDELVNDLKNFINEIPNVTITEKK